MNTRQLEPQDSQLFLNEGRILAAKSLSLMGDEAAQWAYQYADTCQKVVTARIEGDTANYRQALVFPLTSAPKGDFVLPLDVQALHVLLELCNGALVYFKLLEHPRSGFALGEFLSRIGHCFHGSIRSTTSPAVMERCSISAIARRFVFSDFSLNNKSGGGFFNHTPDALEVLARSIFCGFSGLPHLGKKAAQDALATRISHQFNDALADFMENLNQDVMRSIVRAGDPLTILRYNAFTEGYGNAAHFRVQAADAFPLLGGVLAEAQGLDQRLRLAIDVGKPLWPILADIYRVSEETIRWLRGKSIDDIGQVWAGHLPDLFRRLECLSPEWRPQTREEWSAFSDFALVLKSVGMDDQHTQWLQEVARIGWCKARRKFEEFRAAPSDLLDVPDLVKDVISALTVDVLRDKSDTPLPQDKLEAMAQAVEESFYAAGVLKQIRSSAKWHELQLRETFGAEAAAGGSKDLLSWPVPYLTPQRVDEDIYAHFLRTNSQLEEEGRMMRHCVGNYGMQCLSLGIFIVSFRHSGGCRISTAQLKLGRSSGVLRFEIIQHRGNSNEAVDFKAAKALSTLMGRLNQEEMMERRRELEESQKQRNAVEKLDPVTGICWEKERLDDLKKALQAHSSYENFHALAMQSLAVLK